MSDVSNGPFVNTVLELYTLILTEKYFNHAYV